MRKEMQNVNPNKATWAVPAVRRVGGSVVAWKTQAHLNHAFASV